MHAFGEFDYHASELSLNVFFNSFGEIFSSFLCWCAGGDLSADNV